MSPTPVSSRLRLIRLSALAVLIALAAYWAGSRWGPRQATSVEAFPSPAQAPASAGRGGQLSAEEAINVRVYSEASPAVANIATRTLEYDVFFDPVAVNGAGSGFVFDSRGYILTNFHVVQGAQVIDVTLGDRSRYTARFVGGDERNDVALLRIDAPAGRQLPVLAMGDSDALQVGQSVLAIGNPFGFESTLTTGVVSALRRTVRTSTSPQVFIDGAVQTDAAINQGNSGGPLLNTRGEVIGINTAIYTPSGATAGIGFAIPINTARQIAQDLITQGRVRRASLGVVARTFGPGVADALDFPVQQGLLIEGVLPNSAALAAGVRGGNRAIIVGMRRITIGGDLLVEIDGQPINEDFDLTLALNRKRPGDMVTLGIYRGSQRMELKATLGER